jgi:hypothetical protein
MDEQSWITSLTKIMIFTLCLKILRILVNNSIYFGLQKLENKLPLPIQTFAAKDNPSLSSISKAGTEEDIPTSS